MDIPIARKRVILDLRHMPTRRAWRILLPAAASPLALAPGCSGDWSFMLPAVEAGAPDTRFESACTAWARSSCGYEARCLMGIHFGWQSVGECVARETLACELAAADEDVSFDEAGISGCQYPNDCASEPPNCFPPGRAAPGQACLRNAACQSGVCIGGGTPFALCGACRNCDAACPSGQMCDAVLSRNDCVANIQPAGPPCISSAECTGLTSCIGGNCVSAAEDGALCDPRRGLVCLWPAECVSSHCIFPTIVDCPL
jgi:hypothetical protein